MIVRHITLREGFIGEVQLERESLSIPVPSRVRIVCDAIAERMQQSLKLIREAYTARPSGDI